MNGVQWRIALFCPPGVCSYKDVMSHETRTRTISDGSCDTEDRLE